MEEMAQVTKILDGAMAEVELRRHSACGKCGGCGNSKEARFEVSNPISAQVGDMVVLEMKTSALISSVLMVYLLPLVNLIIGYGVGYWINSIFTIWQGEGFAILIGFLFMAITFGFIRMYDKKMGLKSSFKPKIKRLTY